MSKRYWITLLLSLGFGFAALWLTLPEAFAVDSLQVLYAMSVHDVLLLLGAVLGWWLLGGLRTVLLARSLKQRLSWWQGVRTHVMGIFASTITPSGSGNSVGLAWLLTRYGLPLHQAISVAMFSMVLDMAFFAWSVPLAFFFLLTQGVALPVSLGPPVIIFSATLLLLSLLLTFRLGYLIFILVLILKRLEQFLPLGRSRQSRRFLQGLAQVSAAFASFSWQKHLMLHSLTAALWLMHFVLLNIIVGALRLGVPQLELLALHVLILSLSFVVPTPGGSGYVELALAWLLRGQASAQALSMAIIVWRLCGYYLYFLVGPLIGGFALSSGASATEIAVNQPGR